MDPIIDLVQLLRPKATLWKQIHAAGHWAITFPKKNDLLFCSIVHGECLMIRPSEQPLRLTANDFLLIRTSKPFRFTSDMRTKPINSLEVFSGNNVDSVELGDTRERPALLRGGRFLFESANESLLTAMMPDVVHIPATANRSERIRMLLSMNASEVATSGPANDFVISRLMELLFVEVLRDQSRFNENDSRGLLAGLRDAVIEPALRAIHADIQHGWTVAELASACSVSRSRFALRFQTVVGVSPIRYLLEWRIALAKEELKNGTRSISEIAFLVGFQSVSAFSTAFNRTAGTSPRRYAESQRA